MNLTLEERERLSYITNSPDHPLVVLALEGDGEARKEIADLEAENTRLEKELEKVEGELEDKETEFDTMEAKLGDTIVELREQIESSGIDLV